MSISQWWEERLKARDPLGTPAIKIDGYNYKPQMGENQDSWPRAVARSALYDDYRYWFADRCVKPLLDTPYYSEFPEKLPKVKPDLDFFVTVKPWIYFDKKHQVKNYWVFMSQQFEGRWIKVKVRRYFIRLGPWEEHANLFLLDTGTNVLPSLERGPLT